MIDLNKSMSEALKDKHMTVKRNRWSSHLPLLVSLTPPGTLDSERSLGHSCSPPDLGRLCNSLSDKSPDHTAGSPPLQSDTNRHSFLRNFKRKKLQKFMYCEMLRTGSLKKRWTGLQSPLGQCARNCGCTCLPPMSFLDAYLQHPFRLRHFTD